jgi:hypothetical protein
VAGDLGVDAIVSVCVCVYEPSDVCGVSCVRWYFFYPVWMCGLAMGLGLNVGLGFVMPALGN